MSHFFKRMRRLDISFQKCVIWSSAQWHNKRSQIGHKTTIFSWSADTAGLSTPTVLSTTVFSSKPLLRVFPGKFLAVHFLTQDLCYFFPCPDTPRGLCGQLVGHTCAHECVCKEFFRALAVAEAFVYSLSPLQSCQVCSPCSLSTPCHPCSPAFSLAQSVVPAILCGLESLQSSPVHCSPRSSLQAVVLAILSSPCKPAGLQ